MSYILEALKKADAERNGALHQAGPLLPPIGKASQHQPAWRRPLPWAAFAALAISLASVGWFAVSRNDSTSAAAAVVHEQAPATATPPAAPAPVPAAAVPEKPKEKPAAKRPVEKKRPQPPEETKTGKATAAEPAVGRLQDLPEQIQREITNLTVGGYIYSGNKADRSVLINNRLLREGDEAAPGLVVEKMTPSGMVLNYKGYRYRRGY